MKSSNLKKTVQLAWQGVNHLLWPAVCIHCGRTVCLSDENLCQSCYQQLLECVGPDYCRRCGKQAGPYAFVQGACPDCLGTEFAFDSIADVGIYTANLQEMIIALKFGGRTELDTTLGFLANSALQTAGFFESIDLFVPVPLHWSRRLSRGFNQAAVLAKRLKHPAARISTDLVRTRRTKRQLSVLTDAGKAKNVAGAFAVRRGHNFTGKNICLVDDIKTSGATLNECAKTLKDCGAEKVFALVLAVAGQYIK